jgi:hypothetical protein
MVILFGARGLCEQFARAEAFWEVLPRDLNRELRIRRPYLQARTFGPAREDVKYKVAHLVLLPGRPGVVVIR